MIYQLPGNSIFIQFLLRFEEFLIENIKQQDKQSSEESTISTLSTNMKGTTSTMVYKNEHEYKHTNDTGNLNL